MRAAVLMLALTLITSCFVGSTFAKYTTGISGNDTARVAKFGVQLTADADLFDKEYESGSLTVVADDGKDVIAPGTTGTATFFTINGNPEVDVLVSISLGEITMATLPAGDYKDYTDLNNANLYTLAYDYKPVKWTLTKNGQSITNSQQVQLTNVNLDVINDYLESELSGTYHATDTDNQTNDFDDIVGDYALTWVWAYDTSDGAWADDIADTYMGQIAAGVVTPDPVGYVANETFALTIRVEQVD